MQVWQKYYVCSFLLNRQVAFSEKYQQKVTVERLALFMSLHIFIITINSQCNYWTENKDSTEWKWWFSFPLFVFHPWTTQFKVENDQNYSKKKKIKEKKNLKQITEKCLPKQTVKIWKPGFLMSTSPLLGGLHQTFKKKKSTSMCPLCSVCSHNYAHIHIKPEMRQTKGSVP